MTIKNKATFCNQIVEDFSLSKSGIVPGNARWIYHGMALFHIRGGSRAAATSKMECFSILGVAAALDLPLHMITT